jgi:large subunit ribosomal protein L24
MSTTLQRVVRRAVRVERHAKRKVQKLQESREAQELREMKDEMRQQRRALGYVERSARIQHREDWFLGPLAPRRDVGQLKTDYGAFPKMAIRTIEYCKPVLEEFIETARKGQDRNYFFKRDRVVIIRGPGKGMIGVVDNVNWEQQTANLRNTVMVSTCPMNED